MKQFFGYPHEGGVNCNAKCAHESFTCGGRIQSSPVSHLSIHGHLPKAYSENINEEIQDQVPHQVLQRSCAAIPERVSREGIPERVSREGVSVLRCPPGGGGCRRAAASKVKVAVKPRAATTQIGALQEFRRWGPEGADNPLWCSSPQRRSDGRQRV